MDPDATMVLLGEALAGGDWEAVEEHCQNLNEWLERGGHMPTNPVPLRRVLDQLAGHARQQ